MISSAAQDNRSETGPRLLLGHCPLRVNIGTESLRSKASFAGRTRKTALASRRTPMNPASLGYFLAGSFT